jgi:hypothetical protein
MAAAASSGEPGRCMRAIREGSMASEAAHLQGDVGGLGDGIVLLAGAGNTEGDGLSANDDRRASLLGGSETRLDPAV